MAKSSQGGKKSGKGQVKDAAERKRDERAVRNAYRRKKKEESYLADDENFASFSNQLQILGLKVKDIPGDGNCLFRALGDQLEGHGRNHLKHREEAVEYIRENRDFFEPFMEDNIPFEEHISNLSNSGTYAGNDSIVAFAKRHNVNVVIHQLNSPVWKISGSDNLNARELHISYHNGDHYSSVRKNTDNDNSPTNFRTFQISNESEPSKGNKKKERWKSKDTGAIASNYPECNGVEDDALSDLDLYVMQESGCTDLKQVKEVLEDMSYDAEAAISYLLQLEVLSERLEPADSTCTSDGSSNQIKAATAGSLWSKDGTANRIFGDLDSSDKKTEPNRTQDENHPPNKETQGKQRINNRQKKQQQKQERKQRQTERHRQRILGEKATDQSQDGEEEEGKGATVVLAGEMGSLCI